jgi:S-adenosylmethionine:tRNA ribosyltransferase-isomerase
MLTDDFDYDLPEASVAQHALPRGTSRLLVVDAAGEARHRTVADLPALLRPGDLVVVNNTACCRRGIFARLPRAPASSSSWSSGQGPREWDSLAKPGKRARVGLSFPLEDPAGTDQPALTVEIVAKSDDGRHRVRFSEPVEPHLERIGHVPLPAVHQARRRRRRSRALPDGVRARAGSDRRADRRPALHARDPGRARPPRDRLCEVTLHVGIGTFKPVTAALVHEHRMEGERWEIGAEAAAAIAATRAPADVSSPIGTTVVRTLESAAADLPPGGDLPAGNRPHRALHHARLCVSRRRPVAHQLPPAALDPAHAGRRLRRARARARRVPRGDRPQATGSIRTGDAMLLERR